MQHHLNHPLRLGSIVLLVIFSFSVMAGTPHPVQGRSGQGSTPTMMPAKLPFVEDFSNAKNPNSWWVDSDENGSATIADKAYTVTTKTAPYFQWVYPDAVSFPSDVDVQVTAQAANTTKNQDWAYGIGVRGRDVGDSTGFYFFEVWGNGNWSFVLSPNGDGASAKVLNNGTIQGFKPDAANTLRLIAAEDQFYFLVNGVQVGTIEDATLGKVEANYVMLVTETKKTVPATIKFTNFSVVAPEAAAKLPFTEDFADANVNRWPVVLDKNVTTTVANDAYIVKLTSNGLTYYSFPIALSFPSDVDVSVTAQVPDAGKNLTWGYGLAVRGQVVDDGIEFYKLDIAGNGSWSFAASLGRSKPEKKLANGKIAGFDPKATNVLRVVAAKDNITFYVNGKQLGKVTDSTLKAVDANFVMVVAHVEVAPQTFQFTHLTVAAP